MCILSLLFPLPHSHQKAANKRKRNSDWFSKWNTANKGYVSEIRVLARKFQYWQLRQTHYLGKIFHCCHLPGFSQSRDRKRSLRKHVINFLTMVWDNFICWLSNYTLIPSWVPGTVQCWGCSGEHDSTCSHESPEVRGRGTKLTEFTTQVPTSQERENPALPLYY